MKLADESIANLIEMIIFSFGNEIIINKHLFSKSKIVVILQKSVFFSPERLYSRLSLFKIIINADLPFNFKDVNLGYVHSLKQFLFIFWKFYYFSTLLFFFKDEKTAYPFKLTIIKSKYIDFAS